MELHCLYVSEPPGLNPLWAVWDASAFLSQRPRLPLKPRLKFKTVACHGEVFHCHLGVSPVEGVTSETVVCCVECQPTELMIPQSNVMGSGIHHLKGDLRDRTACCLTMSSVTVSMPRRSQDFSLLSLLILMGRRNRMIAFCVLKLLVKHYIHKEKEQGLTI